MTGSLPRLFSLILGYHSLLQYWDRLVPFARLVHLHHEDLTPRVSDVNVCLKMGVLYLERFFVIPLHSCLGSDVGLDCGGLVCPWPEVQVMNRFAGEDYDRLTLRSWSSSHREIHERVSCLQPSCPHGLKYAVEARDTNPSLEPRGVVQRGQYSHLGCKEPLLIYRRESGEGWRG